MDVSLLDAAGSAIVSITEPLRLLYLLVGVLFGLVLGVIPGLSGLIGLVVVTAIHLQHEAASVDLKVALFEVLSVLMTEAMDDSLRSFYRA
jgi:TctA family transporter